MGSQIGTTIGDPPTQGKTRADTGRPRAARLTAAHSVPRWSSGHVLMVGAGLLGALLTFALIQRADDRVEALAVSRDVGPGATLTVADVRVVRVAADADITAELFTPDRVGDIVGRATTVRLRAGQLLATNLVAEPRDRARVMTFSVPLARGVNGDLVAGDRVDVLAATSDGRVGYVLVDAAVLGVDDGDTGGIGSAGRDDVSITLAVDSDGAVRLAGAMGVADITVIRSTSAVPLRRVDWFAPSAERAPITDFEGIPTDG